MAAAISTAFQSTTAEDEDSLVPSRKAPPVPGLAYANTQASQPPEQGELPIHQRNSDNIRAQQLSQFPLPPQSTQIAQYPPSRPSTQQTIRSQPGGTSARGRQHVVQPSTSSIQPDAAATAPPPKKRSNSFSFLRRSTSQQPTSRIAQVQQQQQQQQAPVTVATNAQQRFSAGSHNGQPSDGSATSGSTGLFRARSKDGRGDRNMLRKQSKLKQQQQAELERQQRMREAATRQPPRLPQHNPLPDIATFGGESAAAAASSTPHYHHAYTNSQAPPAVPSAANYSRSGMAQVDPRSSGVPSTSNGEYYEPTGERAPSITNRGRYSYASSTAQIGSVNSPRRVRRRKDPTPFNVLVIGTKNSGKTSFISFLRNSLGLKSSDRQQDVVTPLPSNPKSTFTSQYLETEIDGERVGVTLWDSAGFEKNIVDLQLREMTAFIESKFEDTFSEEQKVVRSPGFRDTHIHCVFLVLDPIRLDATVLAGAATTGQSGKGLDADLDLQVLKALWGKTTVIPVIAKADTLTTNHMNFLKKAVWQSIKSAKLNPLDALELDDDDLDEADEDDEAEDGERDEDSVVKRPSHNRNSSLSSTISDEDPYIPMSILSPDTYSMPPYTKYAPKSQAEIGRQYAWGFASPFNPNHCDFIRLKETVFSEWRGDLRELSRVKWYEQWRTSRLRNAPPSKSRGPSISQGIPIRDAASRQDARNFSTGSRAPIAGVGRPIQPIYTQQPPSSQPPPGVGMAVTTPGGMEAAPY